MLGTSPWLCGDHRTLADAYFIGIARWADYHDVIDQRAYPKIHDLRMRLEDDPAVQFAYATERGENATSSGAFEGEVDFREIAQGLVE